MTTKTLRSPVLLTNADYYGTLAAARSLGRYGVPVTVAHPGRLGAASWSRFVSRGVRCPPTHDSRVFLEWLLAFGDASPGHVLYPASDDAAFIYARHREELGTRFSLYQPGIEAIYALLNKRRLYAETLAVGLDAPRTWFPQTPGDFERIVEECAGPLIIKPVTQILFPGHRKGELVADARQLRAEYESFASEPYARELVERDPDVGRPMVQQFLPDANRAIYSLSGFVTETGQAAARAAVKVLQLPRQLGVGICFEDAPVDPKLLQPLLSLCKRVGYYGVFEAEFVCRGEARLLIDFNPRFFGQMGFDVARGLPLEVLAYEAALGHQDRVAELLWESTLNSPDSSMVFCHRMALGMVLTSQRISQAMAKEEARGWRAWLADHPTIDAVLDPDDWVPAAADFLSRTFGYARHPRWFVRTIVMNR